MKKVIFETEEAVFQFDRKDVKRHLKFLEAEHGIEAVPKLLEFISGSSNSIVIPKEHSYFGYVTLDLRKGGYIAQGFCNPATIRLLSILIPTPPVG